MILRILAIVAALAAGALFFMSKGQLAEQKSATEQANLATQAVQAELATANERISTLETSLTAERESLADEKRKLESVRSEMYTARQEVTRTQQQLNQAKQSISDLETTAQRLRADLLESEQTLPSASNPAETAQLNERIAELEATNADLKESVEELKARAQATRATATTQTANAYGSMPGSGTYSSQFTPNASQPLPVASIGPETTITSVSPENGLIILANTAELGLAPGSQVRLVKDMQSIGSIQVVQIKNDLVIANILPGAKTRSMTQGSTVRLLP
jgi:predicted  nucleic acid-binding Zn-ribbon protein